MCVCVFEQHIYVGCGLMKQLISANLQNLYKGALLCKIHSKTLMIRTFKIFKIKVLHLCFFYFSIYLGNIVLKWLTKLNLTLYLISFKGNPAVSLIFNLDHKRIFDKHIIVMLISGFVKLSKG